jgi:hypothetical protein
LDDCQAQVAELVLALHVVLAVQAWVLQHAVKAAHKEAETSQHEC